MHTAPLNASPTLAPSRATSRAPSRATSRATSLARSLATSLSGLLLGLALPAASAGAAAPAVSPQQAYQQDRARCATLADPDRRANCLSRASSRLARTQPTPASESPEALRLNALKRCEPLPEPTRSECLARMQGQGQVSGSVAGGGLLRELVTIEPAPVAAAGPTPPRP